jgi:DNA-binding NarL/FixJ family response regulator
VLGDSPGSEVVEAVGIVKSGHSHVSQPVSDAVVQGPATAQVLSGVEPHLKSLVPPEPATLGPVVDGKSTAEAGDILSVCKRTLVVYRSRLVRRPQVDDVIGLTRMAMGHGLDSLE